MKNYFSKNKIRPLLKTQEKDFHVNGCYFCNKPLFWYWSISVDPKEMFSSFEPGQNDVICANSPTLPMPFCYTAKGHHAIKTKNGLLSLTDSRST